MPETEICGLKVNVVLYNLHLQSLHFSAKKKFKQKKTIRNEDSMTCFVSLCFSFLTVDGDCKFYDFISCNSDFMTLYFTILRKKDRTVR